MNAFVVKLGGSNATAPELQTWLSALAGAGAPVVIVPGGGPFADFIRETQPQLGFSDKAAHAMAILAMEQFAQFLLDRDDRLTSAHTLDELQAALEKSRPVVWLPSTLALAATDMPASWDVTSDSLAAWLARCLGCRNLLLIKQTADIRLGDTRETLTSRGIIDTAFADMMADNISVYVAGPADAESAAADLAAGRLPGQPIERAVNLRKAG